MLHRFPLAFVLLAGTSIAQTKPAAPATWMDLAVGTDVGYAVDDENTMKGAGGGTGSGGSGKHAVRIVVLGAADGGALRIAIFDEQLPKESFETAIVRGEIMTLEPATGVLQRDPAAAAALPPEAARWSPAVVFPFPPLTTAEWKAKKAVARTGWAPVAGEPHELPLRIAFGTRKDGKKQVPELTIDLDSKEPVTVQLVGIAGMVSMAEGKMPKLGASGIEPVDALLQSLQRRCTIDAAKGRVTEIRTTGTVTAAGGKLTIACNSVQRETERRVIAAKDLPLAIEVVDTLCAVIADHADTAECAKRVEALMPKAKQAGFAATAERLRDSLTRSGLPPGIGR